MNELSNAFKAYIEHNNNEKKRGLSLGAHEPSSPERLRDTARQVAYVKNLNLLELAARMRSHSLEPGSNVALANHLETLSEVMMEQFGLYDSKELKELSRESKKRQIDSNGEWNTQKKTRAVGRLERRKRYPQCASHSNLQLVVRGCVLVGHE